MTWLATSGGPYRGGLVGGVDARREAAGGDGGHVGDVPLGGVEAQDADRLEAAQAQLDEPLGGGHGVTVVLLPAPHLAIAAW